ncbi:MAG TPA: NfeD family protein [Spirochaetota bacterium]|nr:NfeD family protein [Spirochaetota bacterium]HOM38861.1 NfeD family protein [Spirochaetota bacterium]HPQ49156.1 NfeD family protein [Spirochaetota bacterium]
MVKKLIFLIFIFPFYLFSDNVGLIKIDTTINPVIADFIKQEIKRNSIMYKGLIIQLDTPGGLLDSTRDIITEIFNSPIPVICYVDKGGRAASAGFFILISCDISIMNINSTTGAATPVSFDKDTGSQSKKMEKKIMEDTQSYLRVLADRKKLPLKPLLDAVIKASSYTALEAKKLEIIDYVINDIQELGKVLSNISINKNNKVYNFSDVRIEQINIPWYKKLMAYIYNPTLVYILLILGVYGIIFEFFTPGIGFPGIFGIFSLTLSLVGLSIIPVSYGGLFLIIIGMLLFIVEIFVVSYGLLAIGGSFFIILGSFLYFDKILNTITITITIVTIIISVLLVLVIGKSIKLKKSQSFSDIVGKEGVVKNVSDTIFVMIDGEIWQAITSDRVSVGDRVRVKKIKDLIVEVEKI